MAPSTSGPKADPWIPRWKKIGSGAQASVHLLEPTAAAQAKNVNFFANLRRQICPVPPKSQKGLSSLKLTSEASAKSSKLYNNHFPKLRDEGMLATMPFKGGLNRLVPKKASWDCPVSVTKAFSVLPLVSHLSQNLFIFCYRSSIRLHVPDLELMDADFWTIAPALAKTKKSVPSTRSHCGTPRGNGESRIHGTGHPGRYQARKFHARSLDQRLPSQPKASGPHACP
jgi:hypothetical protein